MCKNKYFNLISAVWSLSAKRHRRTASRNCIACISPQAALFRRPRSSCQLHKSKNANCFRSLGSGQTFIEKADRFEIWGIKMPFAIIASPRKFMSICESLCVQKGNENCAPVEFPQKSPGETKRLDTKSRRTQKAIVLKIEDEIGWLNVGSTQQLCVGKRMFVSFSSPFGWMDWRHTKTTPEKCIKA